MFLFSNNQTSSILTKKFLFTYFKCFKCNEIPSNPILLNSCNHFYCQRCLNLKKNINIIFCPFCNELNNINEFENKKIMLLINEINSMNDLEFIEKFSYFKNVNYFNRNNNNIKNIVNLCYEYIDKKNKNDNINCNIGNNQNIINKNCNYNNNVIKIFYDNNSKINNIFVFDLKKRTFSQLIKNNNINKENYLLKSKNFFYNNNN